MKNNILQAIFCLIVISSLLISCVPSTPETPMPPTEEPSLKPDPTATSEAKVRFTIQSEEELDQPISTLYQAYFGDELPLFVETAGDLVVTYQKELDDVHPSVPTSFMPGAVLIPQNENDAMTAFIDFAISVDGQKALIASGELPDMITLTDQAGNVVSISQPVERVISSYGPTTAIVYTVHGKDRLVSASYLGARDPLGSSAMAEIDPRFPSIMGDDKFSQQEFNVEEAATLEPDLILTSARSAWLEIAGELEVPILLYEAECSESLKEAVLLTGSLFGPHTSAAALAWLNYYETINDKILEKIGNIPAADLPRVLFTGTEPLRVASGDMYQTEIIEAAGGISVSKDLSGYWNDVNLEQVAIWDPDIIIVPSYGGANVESITESPEWQILEAVQAGRVYQMPKLVAPWDTPAPDSVLGIIWMAQLLHPNRVDFNCSEESTYFYNTFFHYSIANELTNEICSYD